MKKGRPKWQMPALKEIEGLASRGLTEGQIAAALGICHDTLIEKKKEFSEFSEAIKRGKARGISQISNSLFDAAKSGNTTAQIFYLKTQAGWKETQVLEHAGKIDVSKLSDDELQAIVSSTSGN